MVFQAWPKTPRLFKGPMVITEKIDGTNAAVVIIPESDEPNPTDGIYIDGHWVYAQSRTRLIPLRARGMDDIGWRKRDNAGFGEWVRAYAPNLVAELGPGYHYGEWWGNGIQRGYGLQKGDKRFSLFNTKRWGYLEDPYQAPNIPGLGVVPVIEQYEFDTEVIREAFAELMGGGSYAAPGFMEPEGLVVYHAASDQVYKVTENGDRHKTMSLVALIPGVVAA
jgi:hypothetical protein